MSPVGTLSSQHGRRIIMEQQLLKYYFKIQKNGAGKYTFQRYNLYLFYFGHLLATQIILLILTQAQTIRQHQNGQGFLPHQIRRFMIPLIYMRLKTRNFFSKIYELITFKSTRDYKPKKNIKSN